MTAASGDNQRPATRERGYAGVIPPVLLLQSGGIGSFLVGYPSRNHYERETAERILDLHSVRAQRGELFVLEWVDRRRNMPQLSERPSPHTLRLSG